MGFRFWRRLRIAPGVTLSLSRTGVSLSLGPRGARFTVGSRGERVSLGIPGTGLFYTRRLPGAGERRQRSGGGGDPVEERLDLGFFRRLVTPPEERELVDGCRELAAGNEDAALEHLSRAVHLADGAYLAGFLALKHEKLDAAAAWLETAAEHHGELGRHLRKYGVSVAMELPVTDEVIARVDADVRGVLLGLVEVYQRQGRRREAIRSLERLLELAPADVVVRLSLAELLLDGGTDDRQACRRVVELAEGIGNESPVHAALLLYRARALRGLGLPDGARETLARALRRKKDRSPALLRALRYERALVYEELGWRKRARRELEKLHAEDPGYEDVAERLGMGG